MNHGEIYWYTFKAPDKRRPVLILTRTSAIRYLTGITVAPITTTIRGIPTEVQLSLDDGLYAACAVNLDKLQTVQKHQLAGYITRLSGDTLRLVYAAIEFALGFDTTL